MNVGTEKVNILVINPGSTSTKLALFNNEKCVFQDTIHHSLAELSQFSSIEDQYQMRKQAVLWFLSQAGQQKSVDLEAIVSRGGTLRPVPGGTYLIDEVMVNDFGVQGSHPCNLGGKIAFELAQEQGALALTVDPPSTDELCPYARLSGIPQIERRSSFHALNQKATARHLARRLGKEYEALNLIIVHLGGGISVGAHQAGRAIDVNNALDGDGPFSPERSGGLPVKDLVDICYSGKYSREEVYRLLNGGGGLAAYLKTKSGEEVEARIAAGDRLATLVYRTMAYQVAKEVGAMAAVLEGRVDAIGLTGGLAHSELLTGWIRDHIEFIAPVHILPGELEMEALAAGATRVLKGVEPVKTYHGIDMNRY